VTALVSPNTVVSSRVLALFPDDVPRYRGGEDGSILNGAIYPGQSVPKPHHPHCEKFLFSKDMYLSSPCTHAFRQKIPC